ncbi:MAG TPA: hypothetical protein VHR36_00885 [Pyrinomonadaceae bacterium]|nr:hypothetical protein [Pyrinomonadaceae bacterium]
MSKLFHVLAAFVLVTLLTGHTVLAQSPVGINAAASANAAGAASLSPASQITGSLANLPEADTIIYINPQRILNEAVPKFMPAKDVEEMRKGFEAVKTQAGVDLTKIEYLVIAVRFKKPTADLNFQPPEFLAVASGDFNADSLLALARTASQGKLRDEKYGTRTLGLMTIDPLLKMADQNPLLKSFTEVGIVSLNGNTIAVGTPGYLRAAVDAGEGKDRISAETLNSLVRDPNALISLAGSPWRSFAKSFGMLGTEVTPRAPRCDSKLGDLYLALTMDATNFMLRGVSNADNPDTAKIMSRLYSSLLAYATQSIPDPTAKSLMSKISLTAEGDEVVLRADVPQQTIVELIQQHATKKAAAPPTSEPEKPPVKKRRTRRRTRN